MRGDGSDGKAQYRICSGQDERFISSCKACAAIAQYLLNMVLLFDLAANTVLAGDPNESVSQRAARARRAGSKAATAFCSVLTWVWKYAFRSSEPDHCLWALSPGSIGREVWAWSDDPPNPPPPPDAR